MAFRSRLAAAARWLRDTGPDGGRPWHGNIPLLALRGRELTDDDVTLIAGELCFSLEPDSEAEIRQAIRAITRMTVGAADVARVRARLALPAS